MHFTIKKSKKARLEKLKEKVARENVDWEKKRGRHSEEKKKTDCLVSESPR